METYKQTLHSKLKLHHERHVYKRGANQGDAPAGPRGKTHYLVIDRKDHMVVRFWHTDIIKAYPDGSVVIDCNGYAGRTTTKSHLNGWLGATIHPLYVGSQSIMSTSQLVLTTPKGRYKYYDGITVDVDGNVTSELKPFYARRIDKDDVAELVQAMDENGFKEMFKVLWGAAMPEDSQTNDSTTHMWRFVRNKLDIVDMPDVHAEKWRELVARFAFDSDWEPNPVTRNMTRKYYKLSAPETWSAIMKWFKQDMYRTIETEVYHLERK